CTERDVVPPYRQGEGPGRKDGGLIDGPAVGEDLDDVEIRKGYDQREQGCDLDDITHHWNVDVPDLLEPIGAVDRRGLVQLFGHRFEGGEIHDHEERRADP